VGKSEAVVAEVLDETEPHPLEIFNARAQSPYLLICEHAGKRIPASLGDLGLTSSDLERHIAWDIGARDIALRLSERLSAPLYMQRYSRLVCDCNRRPDVPAFIPDKTEDTEIPGNIGLSVGEREARTRAIFWPFHNAVSAALDQRQRESRPTILLTIHSFTPVFLGRPRPWEIGVLFNQDQLFAPAVARWLQEHTSLCIGVNEPYRVGDETDYAIPIHGEGRGIPCVEFEIRNDLIEDSQSANQWAQIIQTAVAAAATSMGLIGT
jgi:predicted N-formylglutamate amidohydrolase